MEQTNKYLLLMLGLVNYTALNLMMKIFSDFIAKELRSFSGSGVRSISSCLKPIESPTRCRWLAIAANLNYGPWRTGDYHLLFMTPERVLSEYNEDYFEYFILNILADFKTSFLVNIFIFPIKLYIRSCYEKW